MTNQLSRGKEGVFVVDKINSQVHVRGQKLLLKYDLGKFSLGELMSFAV